jgi:arylsulfatase A-like enzyme
VKSGLVVDEVVQNIDFLPTILDICGVTPPKVAELDGMNFRPLLTGANGGWRDEALFEVEAGRAVRTDRWKYIAFRETGGMWRKFEKQLGPYGGERDLLFDLENDPGEKTNLFKDPAHAEVVEDMQTRLRRLCAGYSYPFGDFGGGGAS